MVEKIEEREIVFLSNVLYFTEFPFHVPSPNGEIEERVSLFVAQQIATQLSLFVCPGFGMESRRHLLVSMSVWSGIFERRLRWEGKRRESATTARVLLITRSASANRVATHQSLNRGC